VIHEGTKLIIHGQTDVGQIREHNEDFIAWEPAMGLIMLADGMGGHNAGEVASELGVKSIREALVDVLRPDLLASNVINFADALRESIIYANEEIIRVASERLECAGMGTTIVVALFHGERVIFGHVGDSRIYRYRDNALTQMTSDHSLIQEMLDNGFISEEEAQVSASRNLITRALGIADTVEVDIREDEAQRDDFYILCSDGLTDLVVDEEIEQILVLYKEDPKTAVAELINFANEKGGKDNISVIIVSLEEAYSDSVGVND